MVTDLRTQANAHNTAETLLGPQPDHETGKFHLDHGRRQFCQFAQLASLDRYCEALPLAFLARPGYSIRALSGRAALRYATSRVKTDQAAKLVTQKTPAWVFLPMPLRPESSTAIRNLNQPREALNNAPEPIKDKTLKKPFKKPSAKSKSAKAAKPASSSKRPPKTAAELKTIMMAKVRFAEKARAGLRGKTTSKVKPKGKTKPAKKVKPAPKKKPVVKAKAAVKPKVVAKPKTSAEGKASRQGRGSGQNRNAKA